jgi:cytochrome oxidase Cu insertion factor (SCO1/SenC/PrrC family)
MLQPPTMPGKEAHMNSAVRFWIILVAVLAGIYGSFVLWRGEQQREPVAGTPVRGETATTASSLAAQATLSDGPVAPFTLIDQDGNEFDTSQLEGKVWVASFFFTNCPAICWRMNQALAAWQHTHPEADVHFVSITCDPDNDTPAALKKYAEHFKADPKRWTFLTGDMAKIQEIGQKSFHISVVKGDHTDRACVVDKAGKVRGRFRLTEPDQAELLDRLLMVVEDEPAPLKAETAAELAVPGAGESAADARTEPSPVAVK